MEKKPTGLCSDIKIEPPSTNEKMSTFKNTHAAWRNARCNESHSLFKRLSTIARHPSEPNNQTSAHTHTLAPLHANVRTNTCTYTDAEMPIRGVGQHTYITYTSAHAQSTTHTRERNADDYHYRHRRARRKPIDRYHGHREREKDRDTGAREGKTQTKQKKRTRTR